MGLADGIAWEKDYGIEATSKESNHNNRIVIVKNKMKEKNINYIFLFFCVFIYYPFINCDIIKNVENFSKNLSKNKKLRIVYITNEDEII